MTPLLGTIRAPFLLLAPACASIGIGTALMSAGRLDRLQVALVLAGALLAHVCVNALNEYFDFRSGLDTRTTRTPFSGGSGTLPSYPGLSRATLLLSCAALFGVAAIGAYFVVVRGWLLLPLLAAGLVLLVTYSLWWVYNPTACLLAPGIGFGVLMVMGTHVCLSGTFSLRPFVASLAPTFLVSDLLLLNQFPDVVADRSVGRRHFPITIGLRASSTLYGAFLAMGYLSIAAGVALGVLPVYCLAALLSIGLAIPAWLGARRHATTNASLVPAMALNVIVSLATPALLAAGLFFESVIRPA